MRARLTILAQMLLTALVTFLVLSLALYFITYGAILKTYKNWGRSVVQVECGKLLEDERLYALEPGTCRFVNGEFDTRMKVDADGYRNDPRFAGTGPVHVAVTGDSHALGWGVADGETFAALLGRRPELTVRNLAMSSYGTARELMTVLKLAPSADVVVIQYCDNDYRENAAFLSNPAGFGKSADVQQQMAEIYRQRDRKGFRWSQKWKGLVVRGLGLVAWSWRGMGLPTGTPPADIVEPQDLAKEAEAFGKVLGHFRSYLAGRKVIVLEANNWGRMRPGFAAAFEAAAKANGVLNVRAIDVTKAVSRRDFFYIDEHMTAAGHAKLEPLIYAAWRDMAR